MRDWFYWGILLEWHRARAQQSFGVLVEADLYLYDSGGGMRIPPVGQVVAFEGGLTDRLPKLCTCCIAISVWAFVRDVADWNE